MNKTKIFFGLGAVTLIGLAGLTAWSAQPRPRGNRIGLTQEKSENLKAQNKWDASQPAVDPQTLRAAKLRDRGTQIKPNADARGEELEAQREIAEAINRLNEPPEQRLTHFAWCERQGVACAGWYGVIKEKVPILDGWAVKVRVSPYLVSDKAAVTLTPDYVMETYSYVAGRLTYIEGISPAEDLSGSIQTY